jgi:uncharacterized membrane protein YwzB
MDPLQSAITELILFFILFPLTFKAMMAADISSIFKKGAIWQIQIIYIFISIGLAYLVTRGLMRLIELTSIIAGL